ncbi:MAG TPA: alpha/beta hydrolase [Oligoflexus sp.]|uniref:alpha/beta fold hydrolase n=1 Tax=Oligoflexus sp. TaxID=1971216 RepID=UPI002D307026|nr:alpha/beta hydrolase [Oligoflexus sp.]HYX33905.1 alpha/beta hydrolase [Oligoflexus sp.]
MKISRFILASLFISLALLSLVYFLLPQLLVDPLISLNQSLSGLSKKSIQIEDHKIYYLEGGHGETIVLLHGIFSEKDHFVDFARELTDRYRVVIPDIPGFGESTRLAGGQYDYATQGKRLQSFFDALGIDNFHIAGNSMGGTLAALYSIHNPARVKSLAFIGAPHGLKTPLPSLMDNLVEQKKAPLVVRSPEEFERMLDMLFFKRPFIPYPVLQKTRASSIQLADDNERIFWRQHENRYILQDNLALITAPTLAIWGENEHIFHPSGAQVLKTQKPDQQVIVMPETGHLPQMEKPKQAARHYLDFIQR